MAILAFELSFPVRCSLDRQIYDMPCACLRFRLLPYAPALAMDPPAEASSGCSEQLGEAAAELPSQQLNTDALLGVASLLFTLVPATSL